MDRRTFIRTTPVAVAAGGALGISTTTRARETHGFRRILEEQFEIHWFKWATDKEVPPCSVHHFVVECPYPAGSDQWLSIAKHKEGQPVWVTFDDEVAPVVKPRRVIFPRVQEGPDGLDSGLYGVIAGAGDTIEERILRVYEFARANGFDNAKPHETEWKVVWVEFRCADGRREHIITGLPEAWSSELPLSVMTLSRIP